MTKRRRRLLAVVLAAVLAVAGIAATTGPAPAANAANAAEFDPGMIISDETFYDSSRMNGPQVQDFLNSKVPSCRSGYTCLKDYWMNSRTIAANAYCSGYQGLWESAASVIARVGAACHINPQALIVLLEKEQGLVTDTWPTDGQYRAATGYGCPDTAPCDAEYYGFFNQVYHAAQQFQRYRAWPGDWNYQAGRWNTILWNPNTACGSSQVYIQNQATAGLYIYTPYRPNQAALNNLYGTGDGCSSYGNRNFWRIFTDWFGSTRGVTVVPELLTEFSRLGGVTGGYGAPISQAYTYPGGGLGQAFRGGWGMYSPATGARFTTGTIGAWYWSDGGGNSVVGYPNGDYVAPAGAGRWQTFSNAELFWSPRGGVRWTTGTLGRSYLASGGPGGPLGYPIGDYGTHGAGGRIQGFENGVLLWGPSTGAYWTSGTLGVEYLAEGGAAGPLGFPTGAYGATDDGGRTQSFERGSMYWYPDTGAAGVAAGAIGAWNDRGGHGGALGGPVRTSRAVGDGTATDFAGGTLVVAGDGRSGVTTGSIGSSYLAAGGPSSAAGLPVGAYAELGAGRYQTFEHGTYYWSAAGGVRYVPAELNALLDPAGVAALGFPVGGAAAVAGGLEQQTQSAWLYWSPSTGARFSTGTLGSYYRALGGPAGALGFPTGPYQATADGGRSQTFQHGTLVWTAAGGVVRR